MAFKDGNAPSSGPKSALAGGTLVGAILALGLAKSYVQVDVFHGVLLIACTLIFYIRLLISLFIYIKRRVSWFEGVLVGGLYGLVIAMFSKWGTQPNTISLFWDLAGMALFAVGSWINSLSDHQRHVWKKQAKNQGHLYTSGLFRHSMHINYFGDSVMFTGFAVVTQTPMSFVPVVAIVLNLIFLQIPQLDQHLKQKYGEEFEEYASKTKKFIPYVF